MVKPRTVGIIMALGLFLAGLVVFHGRADWFAHYPKQQRAGIGIRYTETATKPWEGINEALEALVYVVLDQHGPTEGLKLTSHLIVEVIGPDAKLQSGGHDLNGTLRFDGPVLGPEYLVLVVRQLRDTDGSIRSACVSALHHEYAEHAYPHRIRGDLNLGHEDKGLIAFGRRMQGECEAYLEMEDGP